jgi:hypothetical protein
VEVSDGSRAQGKAIEKEFRAAAPDGVPLRLGRSAQGGGAQAARGASGGATPGAGAAGLEASRARDDAAARGAAVAAPQDGARDADGGLRRGLRAVRLPAGALQRAGQPPAPAGRGAEPGETGARPARPRGADRALAEPAVAQVGRRVRRPLPRPRAANAAGGVGGAAVRAVQRAQARRLDVADAAGPVLVGGVVRRLARPLADRARGGPHGASAYLAATEGLATPRIAAGRRRARRRSASLAGTRGARPRGCVRPLGTAASGPPRIPQSHATRRASVRLPPGAGRPPARRRCVRRAGRSRPRALA